MSSVVQRGNASVTVRLLSPRLSKALTRTLLYLVILLLSIIFSFPLFWLVTTSLKATRQILVFPPVWIPNPVVWLNYVDAFDYAPFALYLRNTLIIVSFSVFGSVVTCSLTAYAFARLRAPGRNLLFGLTLGTMMVPGWVVLIPLYIVFSKLGWINTFKPLVVPPLLGNAFYIFLLRQFFLTLPKELEEAAFIDGSSRFGIWWRIVLPLSKPALGTVALFSTMSSWNSFLGPLLYLEDRNLYTLAIGLRQFTRRFGQEWGLLMAASAMMIFPIIILFFFTQKYFVQGIALTGIKG